MSVTLDIRLTSFRPQSSFSGYTMNIERESTMAANLTDITDATDRVFDIYLRTKAGEDGIVVEHLTVTERRQLAELMGWENTASRSNWIADVTDVDPEDKGGACYHNAIMDRQGERDGDYL